MTLHSTLCISVQSLYLSARVANVKVQSSNVESILRGAAVIDQSDLDNKSARGTRAKAQDTLGQSYDSALVPDVMPIRLDWSSVVTALPHP